MIAQSFFILTTVQPSSPALAKAFPAAARAHEDPELVRLQQVKQLQHRLVDEAGVPDLEPGLDHRYDPVAHLGIEHLGGPGPRLGDRPFQGRRDVRVPGHQALKVIHVLLDDRFVRLPGAQRGVVSGRLGPDPDQEISLRRCRFLHPQRAVVVERRDPVGRLHRARPMSRQRLDQAQDGLFAPLFQLARYSVNAVLAPPRSPGAASTCALYIVRLRHASDATRYG